jgi:hypothetical protein
MTSQNTHGTARLPKEEAMTEEARGVIAAKIEAKARDLYNWYAGNHPTIHCNFMPTWGELSRREKAAWRVKARAALSQPQGDK